MRNDDPAFGTERIGGNPSLCVYWQGEGELLVFLHGIGGNKSNWARQLTFFSPHAKAVAMDIRGYGESDDYSAKASITDFAADVLTVVEHFGARKVHLIGLSLGGRIAQRFAMNYPDRVASLTLADARPDTRDTRTPEQREQFLQARSVPLKNGKTPSDIAPAVVNGLVGPNASKAVKDELIAAMSTLRVPSYLKTIEANLNDDFAGKLEDITAPTLVLVGEHDTTTPPVLSEELARVIPNAELEIIRDSGHLTNVEQPDAFNQRLWVFLQEHGISASRGV
ncbi:MAG: alpha/beta fold hydrolase [Rhizobacter sp.]|nr:alpha/beta fold hydrolase [Rhizobacter sp.]